MTAIYMGSEYIALNLLKVNTNLRQVDSWGWNVLMLACDKTTRHEPMPNVVE